MNPDAAELTDGEVIARSLRTPEAFATVFDRHYAAVHSYAARRAGPDAADDVLADVFLAAFSHRKRFDSSTGSALPWLYGIAGNVLKRRWRTLASTDRMTRSAASMVVSASDSHESEVAARLDSAADWLVVRTLLDELGDGDREALLLYAWEELSYVEIAVAMDIPVGTVRSRINRARSRLRALLETNTEVAR
ncbi:RNA polymerase sigma factor [Nocardioides pocheonensis]|uniref:RNA polymerase sigma factor n=1 Tax=Nocardioides pocheonensis TaxID=661485 RepID=UPI001C82DECF|nr:RNA polymerase sigma factor [Nocardioides pocheonensis]